MSGWVKTAAEWFESDDLEALGSDAVMLHLSALAYSARQLTDGRVPKRQLRRLWPVADESECVDALLKAETWQDAGDDYYLPAWREHILASDEVDRIREQTRVRVERHRRHNAGDHSLCDRCSVVRRNGVSNGVSNTVSNAPPNRTEPNRPTGRRGSAVAADARSAGATRAPRVLMEDQLNATPDRTPWDVSVLYMELENGHSEVFSQPALTREDADGFSTEQVEAGFAFFRHVAAAVASRLEAAGAGDLQERHGCWGLNACELSTKLLTDHDPLLSLMAPTALAETWAEQMFNAYRLELGETRDA